MTTNRPDRETLREALHRIHHVATCRRSDCGERHSYMEIPANPKRDADLILGAAIDELVELRERVKVLEGLKPEFPPRPPELDPDAPKVVGLPRYGLRWEGPAHGLRQPLAVPMDDGYWTPWHIAAGVESSATWPYVLAFARLMEAKLEKNRHKGNREGWLKDFARLREELAELEAATDRPSNGDVPGEAADVANFAMMIATWREG